MQSTTDFLLERSFRTPSIDAFAKGEILQVLLFAVLFGFALHKFGGRGTLVFDWIEKTSHVLFAIVGIIMRVAPIGAFGAMAFTIGKYGVGSLLQLGKLMGTFYLTCLIFILVVLGLIARVHGFSILKFIRYIKEELLIVLGTSSSESVLPRMMAKMENLGVRKSTVGLVIPTGYSFNLDGTSIYLTMAAVFVAQATNTPMTLTQQLTLLAVLLLTSKGAAGVTGSGFIVLAATLSAVGHVPVAGLALILGVDRFMSEARALTNLVGNGVATVVVGRWTGELDEARMNARARTRNPADRSRGTGRSARPDRSAHACRDRAAPKRIAAADLIRGACDIGSPLTQLRAARRIASSSSAAVPAGSSSRPSSATRSAGADARKSR